MNKNLETAATLHANSASNITLMKPMSTSFTPFTDTTALAYHEGRKQAIQMLLSGQIDSFLEWASHDGYFAAHGKNRIKSNAIDKENDLSTPLALDDVLWRNIYAEYSSGKNDDEYLAQVHHAQEAIPHFNQSPLEIILRSAPIDVIKAVFAKLNTPLRAFQLAHLDDHYPIWHEHSLNRKNKRHLFCNIKIKALNITSDDEADDLKSWVSDCASQLNFEKPLILLPLLLGRTDVAETMVKNRLAYSSYWSYFTVVDHLKELMSIVNQKKELLEDYVSFALDVDAKNLSESTLWLRDKALLGQELENLFDEKEFPKSRPKILRILSKGAPIGYYEVMMATQYKDNALLSRLFQAGANPNVRYKTGVPALARLDQSTLTAASLGIWLKAGANPIRGMDTDMPFGDGMCPPPLMSAISSGLTDIVKTMVDDALEPIPLCYVSQGKRWAEPLSTAIFRHHHSLNRINEIESALSRCEPECDELKRQFDSLELKRELNSDEKKLKDDLGRKLHFAKENIIGFKRESDINGNLIANFNDLALWMILEKGESPDGLDPENGEPAWTYASEVFLHTLSNAYAEEVAYFIALVKAEIAKSTNAGPIHTVSTHVLAAYRRLYNMFKQVSVQGLSAHLPAQLVNQLRALKLGSDEDKIWEPLWGNVTPDLDESQRRLNAYISSASLFDLVHAVHLVDDPVLLKALGGTKAVDMVRQCIAVINTEQVAQALAYVASGLNRVDHEDEHNGYKRLSERDPNLTLASFFGTAAASRLKYLDVYDNQKPKKPEEVSALIYQPNVRPSRAGKPTDRAYICFEAPATEDHPGKRVVALVSSNHESANTSTHWRVAKALQAMQARESLTPEVELLLVFSGQHGIHTSITGRRWAFSTL
jgi:hypothetical protein